MLTTKKNSLYTTPQIQNEVLLLLSQEVQKNTITDIKLANFFTLIVHSTIDISRRDQMSLSVRFVSDHGFVKERFLKFDDFISGEITLNA